MGIAEKRTSFSCKSEAGFEGTITGQLQVELLQIFFEMTKSEGSQICFTRAQENKMEYRSCIFKKKPQLLGYSHTAMKRSENKSYLNEKICKQINFLFFCCYCIGIPHQTYFSFPSPELPGLE